MKAFRIEEDRYFSVGLEERLYSTGDSNLDELLEKAFCEGYEYAQREYAINKTKLLAYPMAGLLGLSSLGLVSGCAYNKHVEKEHKALMKRAAEQQARAEAKTADPWGGMSLAERTKAAWEMQKKEELKQQNKNRKKAAPAPKVEEVVKTPQQIKQEARMQKQADMKQKHQARRDSTQTVRYNKALKQDSIMDARRDARQAKALQRDSIMDAKRDARYNKAIQRDSIGGSARYAKALQQDSAKDARRNAYYQKLQKQDSIRDTKRDIRFAKTMSKGNVAKLVGQGKMNTVALGKGKK